MVDKGAVDLGPAPTCAIDREGKAWCWGIDVTQPRMLSSIEEATRISAGRVWCWGDNDEGQLGDGTSRAGLVPIAVADDLGLLAGVAALSWRPYRTTLNDYSATVVWTESGDAWIWGGSP